MWISSGFFIFPGIIPSDRAFALISGIPIRFSVTRFFAICFFGACFVATFVAGIVYLLLVFSRRSCATYNSHLTISKISTNSSSYIRLTKPIFPLPQQSIRLIFFRPFTQPPPINVSKKCAFFASLWNFSEFLRVFAFSPLIFSQFGHLAQKSPLPIYTICPNLTHIWRASIEISPCKFSISPISTGLRLGISPETHLQIPVLSLIGARHLPHADPVL